MSVIIHESKPNIPVLLSQPPAQFSRRIKREPGYRNVFFGKQQQLWRNTVKQHRAIQAHHAAENTNAENIGDENIYPVNISGSNWKIQPGELNTIPKNLLPPPRMFRNRSRKLRRRVRLNRPTNL